jgi:hypothetical protein
MLKRLILMNNQNFRRFFIIFHVTLAVVVLVQSLLTIFNPLHSSDESHLGEILPWFASVEALAAILFLIPQTLKAGAWILLAIFAIAIILHGPVEQISLFVYAAGVLLVMFQGRSSKNSNDAFE